MENEAVMAPDGKPVGVVQIAKDGLQLDLMDWGGTWLSCLVPMGDAPQREILLGCEDFSGWFSQKSYLNTTVGRYANRIAGARLSHEGKTWALVANQGQNQLHGGAGSFALRRWQILESSAEHVCFGISSPAGDQGFPGNLTVRVTYRILSGSRISMECEAEVDAPSPVGLTNHAYFNLDGVKGDIRQHRLKLAASHYTPVNAEMIPTTGLAEVAGTSFDFRETRLIASRFMEDEQQEVARGYDHAFLLDSPSLDTPVASLVSGDGKLTMNLFTDSPAVQFYTGNHLAGTSSREGGCYQAYEGVCLEPGFLPDSPNHPEWPQPDCWLQPGQVYRQKIIWAFQAL